MDTLDVKSLLAEPAPLHWDRLHATNSPLDEPSPAAPSAAHAHGADAAPRSGSDVAGDVASGASQSAARTPEPDALDLALPWLVRHLGVADAVSAVLAADAETPLPSPATSDATRRNSTAHAQLDRWAGVRGRAAEDATAHRLQGALRLIGWEGRLRTMALADLQGRPLPVLLLLRRGDACVLSRIAERHGSRLLHVVMPGVPPVAFDLPPPVLQAEYTGVALLLRRLPGAVSAPPNEPGQGPLARLAIALQLALHAGAAPARTPASPAWEPLRAAWRAAVAAAGGWRRPPEAPARDAPAFKFDRRRPISG